VEFQTSDMSNLDFSDRVRLQPIKVDMNFSGAASGTTRGSSPGKFKPNEANFSKVPDRRRIQSSYTSSLPVSNKDSSFVYSKVNNNTDELQ